MTLSSKTISVVKATQKDTPEIAKLSIEMLKYHDVLLDDYFTIFPYEQYVEKFKRKLKEGRYILVAKTEGKIVGFLMAEFQKTPHYKNTNTCMINEISVTEKYRSYGIGTILFNRVLFVCKKKKIEEIKLDVYNVNVRAKNFYERLGFKDLGFEDLHQRMSLVLK